MRIHALKMILNVFLLRDSLGFVLPGSELSLHPADPIVCRGQLINITCSLLVPPILNGSFSFDTFQTTQWTPAPGNDVITVNQSEATLLYDVQTKFDYEYIRCSYGNDNTSSTPIITTLIVYSRPKEVSNFTCIVHNYVESMKCTWDYGVDYNAIPDIKFQWMHPRFGAWTDCPCLDTTANSCTWKSIRDGVFSMTSLKFKITLTQSCGLNVSSLFELDTSRLVKPEAVVALSTEVLNSTCILLSWKTDKSRPEYSKRNYVSWINSWGEIERYTFNTSEGETYIQKLFCDLRPNTRYTFSVYIMAENEGYPSDVKTIKALTSPDKPGYPPQMVSGGYMWNIRECDRFTERTVCLLWKPVNEIERNGDKTVYDVIIKPVTSLTEKLSEISMETDADTTYVCFRHLNCKVEYSVKISARNEIGISDKFSSLVIPSSESAILQPDFNVELGSGTDGSVYVYIVWKDIIGQQITNFTVFWCLQKHGECKGNGTVGWRIVESEQNELVLPITSPEDYLYGVSVTSQNGSSGFKWKRFVYAHEDLEPKPRPLKVAIKAGPGHSTSLAVVWDKVQCGENDPMINFYVVQYCNHGNCDEVEVNADVAAYAVIRNVDETETYEVTVRAVYEDGTEGPRSVPVQNRIPGA